VMMRSCTACPEIERETARLSYRGITP
jgi:hypothetical protein